MSAIGMTAIVLGVCLTVVQRSRGEAVWPGRTWVTRAPTEVGMDPEKLAVFRDYVGGRGCVVRHGYMIYSWGSQSKRDYVYSAEKPWYTHFLWKALEDGKIPSLDQKVNVWEPRLNDINADLGHKDRNITWRHLANQTSCYGVRDNPGEAFNYNDYQMALFWDTLFLKVYGADEYPPKSNYHKRVWHRWGTQSSIRSFVMNVLGGCASTRFHRNQSNGIGLTGPAQSCIKAMRKLESQVKMWEVTPQNNLLTDYEDSKVFLSADRGRVYALFFLEGGSASVDLKGYEGMFLVKWINVGTAEWGKESKIIGGRNVTISAPGGGGWIAAIVRRQDGIVCSSEHLEGTLTKTHNRRKQEPLWKWMNSSNPDCACL